MLCKWCCMPSRGTRLAPARLTTLCTEQSVSACLTTNSTQWCGGLWRTSCQQAAILSSQNTGSRLLHRQRQQQLQASWAVWVQAKQRHRWLVGPWAAWNRSLDCRLNACAEVYQ